jgi:hypothetical protein
MAINNKTQSEVYKENFFEFLAEDGYRPEMDNETIDFKRNGRYYWIYFSDGPYSVCIISTLKSYERSLLDREDALELANTGNGEIIPAKANVIVTVLDTEEDDGAIWVSFKSWCSYPEFFEDEFLTRIEALEEGVRRFDQRLAGQNIE